MQLTKILIGVLIATLAISASIPGKYVSRTGHVHVESANRFKDIVADNYQVNSSRLDLSHYSKFKFVGELSNNQSIKWDQAGTYPAMVTGLLYIGSFKRKTAAQGNITVGNDGKIRADAAFTIVIEEESVKTINKMMKEKLPSVMALDVDKLGISRNINLTLTAAYRPRG